LDIGTFPLDTAQLSEHTTRYLNGERMSLVNIGVLFHWLCTNIKQVCPKLSTESFIRPAREEVMIRLWMEASKRIAACKPLLEEKGRNQFLNNGAPNFRDLRGAAK
jgi:hypothetical protein